MPQFKTSSILRNAFQFASQLAHVSGERKELYEKYGNADEDVVSMEIVSSLSDDLKAHT